MHDNTENKEYHIERLNANKLNDLAILYKAVYGHEPEKNYFFKKYNTAYTGAAYIGFIAYNLEDMPVAYYGVIPCFIQYNNEIILSAQAADAMTLTQYRYKGLFVELAKLTFDLCRSAGIKLIFGFPNQNSYHGLVHTLGWKITDIMNRFTIPVKTFPLESLLQHFAWTKWIYKKYTKWIFRKYALSQPGLPCSASADGVGTVYRDDQYLKYKTYSDTQVINIGNAKIWIKIKNGLIIGDLHLAGHNFHAVMNKIRKIAKHLGVTSICFQMSSDIQLHALFGQQYKSEPSFPVIVLDLGAGIPLDKLKFSFADVDIF